MFMNVDKACLPKKSVEMPRDRNIVGTDVYNHGVVAKQPGSNLHYTKQISEKRHAEEIKKVKIEETKKIKEDLLKRKFEEVSYKKNFLNRVQKRVQEGLLAAEEDVNHRRNILRDMLLREEAEYTREYLEKTQLAETERTEQIKKRIQEMKLKKEAEDRRIVEEKRLQQFRSRCEELRTKISENNRKCLKEVHDRQIQEKLLMAEAEKEREMLYYKVMQKDIAAMKEHENMLETERQKKLKDLAEIYNKQMEARELLKKEEKKMKDEEAVLLEKMREEVEKEKREEQEEEKKKQEKRREEIKKYIEKSREIVEWRKTQEKEMDMAFCKLIQIEIDREKSIEIDVKNQVRREFEMFHDHIIEMRKRQEEEEKEAEEMRTIESEKAYKKMEQIRCREIQAKEELRKEVLRQRGLQLQEKSNRGKEEKEIERIERELQLQKFEKCKREDDMLKKEMEMKKKEYGRLLKEQDRETKLLKEMKKREEEQRVQEELKAEEQYIRKNEKYLEVPTIKKHPFLKKLEGFAN